MPQPLLQPGPINVAQTFAQALHFHERGQILQAEPLYAQVLAARPDHFDALQMMGLVKLAKGEPAEALNLVSAAMRVRAPSPKVLLNHGLILNALDRHEEALESFDQALKLKSKYAEAHNNRGAVLAALGRDDEALDSYRKAISIKPDYAEAHYNRGSLLRSLGRYDEALVSLDRALALQPKYVKAHNNRGAVQEAQGNTDAALASYDRALAIDPTFSEARENRGRILCMLGRFDEARENFELVLAKSPDNAEAYYRRGSVSVELNLNDSAIEDFQRALALKPGYAEARFADCMAELPIVYETAGEIPRRRAEYERKLRALSADAAAGRLDGDLPKAVAPRQPFLLAYQGGNDRDLQDIYGKMVAGIMGREFPAAEMPPLPAPGEPLRIGIVSSFFFLHSNWKIPIKGWLSQLDRRRFSLFGYYPGDKRDAETEAATQMFDRFLQRTLEVDGWRREILADAPHILIYPGLFMDTMSVQLAAQRLAPVQCTSWGHPETSGLPTLDYFFSSDLMEPPDGRRALHREAGAAAQSVDLLRAGAGRSGPRQPRRSRYARRRRRVLVRAVALQIPAAVRRGIPAHRRTGAAQPVRVRRASRRPARHRGVPRPDRARVRRARARCGEALCVPGAAEPEQVHRHHRPLRRVPRQPGMVGLQLGAGEPAAQSADRHAARRLHARPPQRRHPRDDGGDRYHRPRRGRLRRHGRAVGQHAGGARRDQQAHGRQQGAGLSRPRLRHRAGGFPR